MRLLRRSHAEVVIEKNPKDFFSKQRTQRR
jgi:hypothetical protein